MVFPIQKQASIKLLICLLPPSLSNVITPLLCSFGECPNKRMLAPNLFINVLNSMVNLAACSVSDKLGCRHVMLSTMKTFMLDLLAASSSRINNLSLRALKSHSKSKSILALIRFSENSYRFVRSSLEYLSHSWDIFIS